MECVNFKKKLNRRISQFILFACLSLHLSPILAEQQKAAQPGKLPPEYIQHQVRPLLNEVRNAQQKRDIASINKNISSILRALGDWAGNPDLKPTYFSPIEATTPNRKQIDDLWVKINKRIHDTAMWRLVPDGNPKKMTQGLRAAGRPIITYSIINSLKNYKKPKNLKVIIKGANYLLKLQQDNGLFPMPDLRGKDERKTTIIKRIIQRNPDAYHNGWITADHRGELLYDHATAGVAMIAAFRTTGDQKYFNSAKAASRWAMSQAIDTNWGNNAFAAWLLAEFYAISNEEIYIKAAIDRINYGVLPGLMDNGRWLDPFNSKLVYHAINVRGMLAVLRQLPKDHPFRKALEAQTRKAISNAATQINSNGASSVSTSTEMLIDALTDLGDNEQWKSALNININATIKQLTEVKATNVGAYLSKYIAYIENQSAKAQPRAK